MLYVFIYASLFAKIEQVNRAPHGSAMSGEHGDLRQWFPLLRAML
jgi:hypothetical protein